MIDNYAGVSAVSKGLNRFYVVRHIARLVLIKSVPQTYAIEHLKGVSILVYGFLRLLHVQFFNYGDFLLLLNELGTQYVSVICSVELNVTNTYTTQRKLPSKLAHISCFKLKSIFP